MKVPAKVPAAASTVVTINSESRGFFQIDHSGRLAARAGVALEPNGPRQHYMRATTAPGSDGFSVVTPVRSQDSSLLAPLAAADCLVIRAPHAPLAPLGALVPILPLDF